MDDTSDHESHHIAQEDCLAIGFFWIAKNTKAQQAHSMLPQDSGTFALL